MNREHILAVLYDLTLAIGGEVHLDSLLTRVLQRLLYHTAYPVGIVLTDQTPAGDQVTATVAAAIGDHRVASRVGHVLNFDSALLQPTSDYCDGGLATAVLAGSQPYPACLRLPVDAGATILLLATTAPDNGLPYTQMFQPVLRNLSRAMVLCRSHESETRTLVTDRDLARSQLEEALAQAERERTLLRSLMDTIPDLIWLKDPDGTYIACNNLFEQLYGAREADIVGKTDFDFVDAEQASFFRENDKAAIAAGRPRSNEEWLTFAEGGYQGLFETTKTPMHGANGTLIGVLGIAHDISARKAAEERIHHLAHHDVLTGLSNRFSFQERTSQALLTAQRDGSGLAMLLIDQDQFKRVNDTLGHHVGDQLLIDIANRLVDCVRESDIVARLGGDEFVVVLTGMEASADASAVAAKILEVLDKPYAIDGRTLHSTASIGISRFPGDGEDVDTLLKNADTAMYFAKQMGRNNAQFFSEQMSQGAAERLELERDLRTAVVAEQFELHYQPKVDAQDDHVVGVEALVRWRHPRHGLIPPMKFIPVAEEIGLIERLGDWVLDEACRQLAAWRQQGIAALHMAVNLSAQQLRSPHLATRIREIMASHGIQPGELELEITESMAMSDPDRAIGQLRALRQAGVGLTIDDFGTGYSSLAYLKQLPIDTLKVDRSFVQDIETDPNSASICAATIALAQSLGLRIIAEGVETVTQRTFLTEHHCDYLQGFLYSKPLAEAEATAFLSASLH